MRKMSSNYQTYLYSDLEKYKGKWIIILDKEIIVVGDNVKKMLEKAKLKYPNKKFMLVKVPTEQTLIY